MHIDLPILTRAFFQNQLSEINLREPTKGQVDIPRLREGGVGGYVWSVYVPCPEDAGYPDQNASNFTDSTWRVISQHFLLHSLNFVFWLTLALSIVQGYIRTN